MTTMASQITSLTAVYSTVYSDVDQRKHQSSALLAFVWEITGTGEFPTQRASYAEMFPYDDVIMDKSYCLVEFSWALPNCSTKTPVQTSRYM